MRTLVKIGFPGQREKYVLVTYVLEYILVHVPYYFVGQKIKLK